MKSEDPNVSSSTGTGTGTKKRGRPRKGEIRPPKKISNGKRGRPSKLFLAENGLGMGKGKKIYECQVCGKVAKTYTNLKDHIEGVHEGIRKHQCPICKKCFFHKNYLNHHVRVTHQGEKNQFVCPEEGCGKTFSYQAGLYFHKIKHSGETKFGCEVCGKRFHKSCNLKEHMARHSTDKVKKFKN